MIRKSVVAHDTRGNYVGKYKSMSDAAKAFSVKPSTISANVLGKTRICQGMVFRLE